PPNPVRACTRGAVALEGQSERDWDDLDLLAVDHAFLRVDIVDTAFDVPVDLPELQRDAGSPVDPEARIADRGRRSPLRLHVQVVGAESSDDIRAYRAERKNTDLEIGEPRDDLTRARNSNLRVVEIETREVEIEPRYHRQLRYVQTRETLHVEA